KSAAALTLPKKATPTPVTTAMLAPRARFALPASAPTAVNREPMPDRGPKASTLALPRSRMATVRPVTWERAGVAPLATCRSGVRICAICEALEVAVWPAAAIALSTTAIAFAARVASAMILSTEAEKRAAPCSEPLASILYCTEGIRPAAPRRAPPRPLPPPSPRPGRLRSRLLPLHVRFALAADELEAGPVHRLKEREHVERTVATDEGDEVVEGEGVLGGGV